MKDYMLKLFQSGNLLLEVFAETLSIAKGCLLLGKYKRFVECYKKNGFFELSLGGLAEVYACQLLNNKYDLKSREKMR